MRLPRAAGRRSFRTSASCGDEPRSSRPTRTGSPSPRRSRNPPTAAEWCLPLVREGGVALLWVGPSVDEERVAKVADRLAARPEPAPAGFVLLRKVGPTPPGFPRRPGVARKRPLA